MATDDWKKIYDEILDAKSVTYKVVITKPNGDIDVKQLSVAAETKETTIRRIVAMSLIQMAISGDIQAIKEIHLRTEGKPPQQLVIEPLKQITQKETEEFTDEEKTAMYEKLEEMNRGKNK